MYATWLVVPPLTASNDAAGNDRFCTDATLITPSPTLGAPVENRPFAPLLPADATTTTPFCTSVDAACASGALAKLLNASPMLMLITRTPSVKARCIAAIMMSSDVEPLHPKTRYM